MISSWKIKYLNFRQFFDIIVFFFSETSRHGIEIDKYFISFVECRKGTSRNLDEHNFNSKDQNVTNDMQIVFIFEVVEI